MAVDVLTRSAILHTVPVYHFSLDFQRITWIPLPSGEPCYLKSQQGSGQLKITVLYGTEQHEIGMFEVLHDECIIDQQLSCRLQCSKPEDLGKLHVYVDEACCSGLAGHIAVDLKEFCNERDCEVHLEYPMHAANAYGFRAANFKMTIQCDHLREEESSSDLDIETIIHWSPKQSRSPCLEEVSCDGYASATETRSLQSLQMHTVDCDGEQADNVGDEGSDEVQLLKDVESILCELNAKLTSVVAPYTLGDDCLGQPNMQTEMKRGKMPYSHVAAFVVAGLLSKLNSQYRPPPSDSLTLSEDGKHILCADSLPVQVKDPVPENSWARPSFVPTSKWDSCSQPEGELYLNSCGSPCGRKIDVMKAYEEEIGNHLQVGSCADCFLCSMRSSNKYEAILSCFSSSNRDTETSLSTDCESSDGSSCPVEDDSCRESAQSCSPAPRLPSAIFQTIFRVVLIAGAAVLGLKGVRFVKRKGRRRGSIGTAPIFQTDAHSRDEQTTT